MNEYGDFAWYYDALNVEAEYEKRAGFIRSLLIENGCENGILLDLACGTGTMSLLFSEMGFDVIGVDASEEMLSIAQEKAAESGESILFLHQPMQSLDLFGTIDACVCTLDGINHLESKREVRKTFEKVSLFMNPGGVFIFDVNTPLKHEKILADNTFVYDVDPVFCVWQNSFDPEKKKTKIILDIFELDDESDESYIRTRETFTETAFELESLKTLLEEAGFSVVGIFNEFEKTPLEKGAQRALFIARKK